MKLLAIIDEQEEHVLAIMMREILLRSAKERDIPIETYLYQEDSANPPKLPQNFLQSLSADNGSAVLLFVSSRPHSAALEKIQSLSGDFHGTVLSVLPDDVTHRLPSLWKKITAARETGIAKNTAAANANANANAAQGIAALPAQNQNIEAIHKIVAVTSCPTGIAHTFMAAEALKEAAEALNIALRVETQGSVGAQTKLTAQEIKEADLVIIAADREVERDRFDGKYIYASGTKAAIADGKTYIRNAVLQARRQNAKTDNGQSSGAEQAAESSTEKGGFYPPLMTGISFMLPFVVAGGLLIALGLAIGGVDVGEQSGTFAHFLWRTGAQGAFPLIVPVLAGYIAFAIADRPGLAPGMVGGFISDQIGSGFIGGIIAGFLAGYITKAAVRYIRLPRSLEGLKPVLLLPLLCTALTGLIMFYIVQSPTAWLLHSLTDWVGNLESQSGGAILNAMLLGALIGGMMAVDMGGPVNKAAYTVAIGLLSVKVYTPMAAAMIGGMTPPLALALACYIRPRCFTKKERDSKEATFIMGLAFISEGAIPFATRDPLRIIPCLVAGSAFAGIIALITATGIIVPHGGIFLLPIKGAIINYSGYFAAIISGMLVSAFFLCIFCRPLPKEETASPAAAI